MRSLLCPTQRLIQGTRATSRSLSCWDVAHLVKCAKSDTGYAAVFCDQTLRTARLVAAKSPPVLCRLDGRFYAVKKLWLHTEDDASELDKVLREVVMLSRLQNRHIVRYFQAWLEKSGGEIIRGADPEYEASHGDWLSSTKGTSLGAGELHSDSVLGDGYISGLGYGSTFGMTSSDTAPSLAARNLSNSRSRLFIQMVIRAAYPLPPTPIVPSGTLGVCLFSGILRDNSAGHAQRLGDASVGGRAGQDAQADPRGAGLLAQDGHNAP